MPRSAHLPSSESCTRCLLTHPVDSCLSTARFVAAPAGGALSWSSPQPRPTTYPSKNTSAVGTCTWSRLVSSPEIPHAAPYWGMIRPDQPPFFLVRGNSLCPPLPPRLSPPRLGCRRRHARVFAAARLWRALHPTLAAPCRTFATHVGARGGGGGATHPPSAPAPGRGAASAARRAVEPRQGASWRRPPRITRPVYCWVCEPARVRGPRGGRVQTPVSFARRLLNQSLGTPRRVPRFWAYAVRAQQTIPTWSSAWARG